MFKPGSACKSFAINAAAQRGLTNSDCFFGLLYCADCGSILYLQRYHTDKRSYNNYVCGSYRSRTRDCTAHFIRTDILTAGVLKNLRHITNYAAEHEQQFMELLIAEAGDKRKNAAMLKELDAAEKRIAELSVIFKRLYEDNGCGRISDERFTELSSDYEKEQHALKEQRTQLQAELARAKEAKSNAEQFMETVRKNAHFEALTHTLLREFVDKIIVHEGSRDEDGIRRQEIEIYYSFVGKLDLPA